MKAARQKDSLHMNFPSSSLTASHTRHILILHFSEHFSGKKKHRNVTQSPASEIMHKSKLQ